MTATGRRATTHAAAYGTDADDMLTAEWESERLDVAAYLRRIAYEGALEPTADVLAALHRAHAASVPFENLDILLGRGISLDLERLQDKLLRHRRGGYCFEHNLLFAALLERAGFEVRRHIARVQPDRPGPRTHMLLNVRIGEQEWLADVGFGAALLEPVPLVDGITVRQGGWTYGLDQREGGRWVLRSLYPDGWSDLYAFTQEPQHLIDYVVSNHYTSTHPDSPFTTQVVAIRTAPDIRHALRGRELTISQPNGATVRREIEPRELPEVLHDTFGIALEPDDAVVLRTHARLAAVSG